MKSTKGDNLMEIIKRVDTMTKKLFTFVVNKLLAVMVKKPKILLALKMGADMGSLFSTHGQREFVIRLVSRLFTMSILHSRDTIL